MLRKFLKHIAHLSPIPLTKNEYYDRLTEKVIKRVCTKNSICVDVGANNGKILSFFIKHCSNAFHYAFEPIPDLYFLLVRKYGSAAKVFKLALSDKKGVSMFSYVVDDPAYSSLKMRIFEVEKRITHFEVDTDCLDNIIPESIKISLIKLDIEGGEYNALLGLKKTIEKSQPIILFEFGKGGSEAFNITPTMIFDLLTSLGYKIGLLNAFLNSKPHLNSPDFANEYQKGKEYFFIAYP